MNTEIYCTITALRAALAEPDHIPDAGKMVAEPCEMGAMCLNCQPRGPNGECPDAPQPKAEQPAEQEPLISGETSDGYHTFNELYEFRKVYNAALFNEWAASGKYSVHKSWRHHDGEMCFGGGWFIVLALLPDGQISNHYTTADWDLFRVPETEKAIFEFDGHTGADVVARLKSFAPQPAKPAEQEPLTREEILELAEPFGEFKYGDAQGHKRIDFANAIIAAYERKNGVQT